MSRNIKHSPLKLVGSCKNDLPFIMPTFVLSMARQEFCIKETNNSWNTLSTDPLISPSLQLTYPWKKAGLFCELESPCFVTSSVKYHGN